MTHVLVMCMTLLAADAPPPVKVRYCCQSFDKDAMVGQRCHEAAKAEKCTVVQIRCAGALDDAGTLTCK